jgi:hypothetical protein
MPVDLIESDRSRVDQSRSRVIAVRTKKLKNDRSDSDSRSIFRVFDN